MRHTSLRFAVPVLFACSISCQKGKSTEEQQKVVVPPPPAPAPPPTAAPVVPLPPAVEPGAVSFEPRQLADVGLRLDTLSGVKPSEGDMGGSVYLRQEQRPVAIAVWRGQGRTLEAWRKGLPPTAEVGQETAVEVCGQKAARQEARLQGTFVQLSPVEAMAPEVIKELPGQPGEASPPPAAEQPPPAAAPKQRKEIRPRTVVAVAFARKQTPVIVTWTVETDLRDAFRAHEDRFFASLACD